MARSFSRLKSLWAGSAAIAAAFSMSAAPVAAAQLPVDQHAPIAAPAHASATVEADTLDWRGRHRHRNGIDGGDILAGVLILGGIAAIASAASKEKRSREDDYRYREPYPDDRPVYREDRSYYGGGIDNAVSICTDQVERGQDRVASVDNAARTDDGWRISGQLDTGGGFSCWIDNDGRIRNVDLGYGYSYDGAGQWDDDTYARARAQVGYAGDYSRE